MENTLLKERILLRYNEVGYDRLADNAKASLPYVKAFVNDINSINDFKCTAEHLDDLLFGDGKKTLQAILSETIKQIDTAGIKSKGLINAALNADQESFENSFAAFKRPEAEISLLYTIENGKIVINKQALQNAKERFCHYIITERGKTKKAQYDAFIKAANDFFNDNKFFNGGLNLNRFFIIDYNRFVETEIDFDNL